MKYKPRYKNVLYIDLKFKTYEFKSHEDLWPFVGGIGVAYKLLIDNIDLQPVVLATGPLAGKFPFVSKSVLLYLSGNRVCEKYGGGNIGSLMNFADIDAIVFSGPTNDNIKINISGRDVSITTYDTNMVTENKNVNFYYDSRHALSENYFSFGLQSDSYIDTNGRISLSIDSTNSGNLIEYYDYEVLYNDILMDFKKLTVEPRQNPSCFGCPMGCDFSAKGENEVNASSIARSLVACGYAESIYKHIPLVYSCFNSIGLKYQHSDLEYLPLLIGRAKSALKTIIQKGL